MYDRIEAAKGDKNKLSMGNLAIPHGKENNQTEEDHDAAIQAASGDESQEDRATPPD